MTSGWVWGQTTQTATYTYNGLPLAIYSDSANVITVANIFVAKALKATKITVQIQTQYPNSADLKIYLFSPEGTRSILLEHDCSVANIDTSFDDSAQSLYKDFCPVTAGGPYRPDQPLSNFYSDTSAFGTWRLAVENDSSDSRSGWLTAFSISVTGTTQVSPTIRPQTVVNAASFSNGGELAPGEMVSVYGVGLGPTAAVTAPVGALPTTLGGTTVLLNGNPAPISYASTFRVDFQAPFSVTPGTTVAVQVSANNQTSAVATVNVVETSPGIYTIGGAGSGPVNAVNQSGSLNSKINPAVKGSVVVIYASGLGAVNPALTAGSVPPLSPLSQTSGAVGAFIGGLPATVTFSGAAPGYPGLYQINVQVPPGAPSGTQSLEIYAKNKPSQVNTTLEVQ